MIDRLNLRAAAVYFLYGLIRCKCYMVTPCDRPQHSDHTYIAAITIRKSHQLRPNVLIDTLAIAVLVLVISTITYADLASLFVNVEDVIA